LPMALDALKSSIQIVKKALEGIRDNETIQWFVKLAKENKGVALAFIALGGPLGMVKIALGLLKTAGNGLLVVFGRINAFAFGKLIQGLVLLKDAAVKHFVTMTVATVNYGRALLTSFAPMLAKGAAGVGTGLLIAGAFAFGYALGTVLERLMKKSDFLKDKLQKLGDFLYQSFKGWMQILGIAEEKANRLTTSAERAADRAEARASGVDLTPVGGYSGENTFAGRSLAASGGGGGNININFQGATFGKEMDENKLSQKIANITKRQMQKRGR